MDMKEGLVSIIVPVYNAEKYIDSCISSLINQTYSAIEIILINDGSTDTSLQKCEKYQLMDSRVHLYNQKNRGVSASRNYGIRMASGQYIAFVDADDYVERGFIESLVRAFPQHGIAICGYKRFEDGGIIAEHIIQGNLDVELLYRSTFANNVINCGCCNKLFSADIIKDNMHFDEKLSIGEDMIFLAEYLGRIHEKFLYIPEANYVYRKNTQSAMQSAYNRKKFDEIKLSCLDAVDKLAVLGKYSEILYIKNCFSYRTVRTCLWLLFQLVSSQYYKKDILRKIKKRIRKNIFQYLKYGEGSKLEHLTALATCFFPGIVYLTGCVLMKKQAAFFSNYLN